MSERISSSGIRRSGHRGRGSAIRSTGPHVRTCQAADASQGRHNAPAVYYRDAVIDGPNGPIDKSLESTAGARVVTREDERNARTLKSRRSLDGINGPIWTVEQSATARVTRLDCASDDQPDSEG
jgi:hypothetical protein